MNRGGDWVRIRRLHGFSKLGKWPGVDMHNKCWTAIDGTQDTKDVQSAWALLLANDLVSSILFSLRNAERLATEQGSLAEDSSRLAGPS